MFASAFEVAARYTCPYVGLRRKNDGTVLPISAAFVVLNPEGWCITAKHIFDEIGQSRQSIANSAKVDQAIHQVEVEAGRSPKHKRQEIQKLDKQRADFLSHAVEIWSAGEKWQENKPMPTDVRLHPVADLAVFKLSTFAPAPGQTYPVLHPGDLMPGTSVCRIGFPWHEVKAAFADNNFDVTSGFPAPLFALEGIVSRFMVDERPEGGKATYIHTSSPGLRGQSGGPLFDVQARLVGLQSSTIHLDLGFNAQYQEDGHPKVERQFLNVGQSVHVLEMRTFLDSLQVPYKSA